MLDGNILLFPWIPVQNPFCDMSSCKMFNQQQKSQIPVKWRMSLKNPIRPLRTFLWLLQWCVPGMWQPHCPLVYSGFLFVLQHPRLPCLKVNLKWIRLFSLLLALWGCLWLSGFPSWHYPGFHQASCVGMSLCWWRLGRGEASCGFSPGSVPKRRGCSICLLPQHL